MEINFSKATDEDDQKIIEMYKKVYPNNLLSEKIIKGHVEHKSLPKFTIVAKEGDKVIGNFMWMPFNISVGWSWILEVVIHPDYQKQGIGTKLIKEGIKDIKRYFKEQGSKAKLLLVDTDDDNDAGLKFYEKMGFKKAAHLGPMLKDTILFAMDLREV